MTPVGQEQHLDQPLSPSADEALRTLLRSADAAQARGEAQEAHRLYEGLLSAGRQRKDLQSQAVAHQRLGDNLAQRGLFSEGVDHMLQGLSLARGVADQRPLADLLNTFSYLHWRKGDLAMATEYNEQLRDLAARLGDSRRTADALLMQGNLAYSTGELSEATAVYAESMHHYARLGIADQHARCLVNLASAHGELGEDVVSFSYAREALDHCRQHGDRTNESYAWMHGAESLARMGRSDEALSWVRRAQEIIGHGADRHAELDLYMTLGEVHRLRRELVGAKVFLERALGLAGDLGVMVHIAMVHLRLGRLAAAQDDSAVAARHFEQGLLAAEGLGRADLRQQLQQALDGIHAAAAAPASGAGAQRGDVP